jgi:hypothetical protein
VTVLIIKLKLNDQVNVAEGTQLLIVGNENSGSVHLERNKNLFNEFSSKFDVGSYFTTLVGLATRYYFLSECCYLKFAALFLWGALSDERTGLKLAV